jgi:ABC-type transport system involved in multi-copper enzyme maturation permease subunit
MSNVPSTGAVLSTMIGLTWRRLFRGRAVWICAGIASLPSLLAFPLRGDHEAAVALAMVELVVMALLSSVFVASSIGEEIEERTITYLWSRPLARWTIVVGKVIALAPIALALTVAGYFVANQIALGHPPEPRHLIAFGAGALATSMIASGIGTLVPKQGMALSIIYLVILDMAIGALPASIREIAVSYQVLSFSGLDRAVEGAHPAIALAIIGGVWMTIGLWRVRQLES